MYFHIRQVIQNVFVVEAEGLKRSLKFIDMSNKLPSLIIHHVFQAQTVRKYLASSKNSE